MKAKILSASFLGLFCTIGVGANERFAPDVSNLFIVNKNPVRAKKEALAALSSKERKEVSALMVYLEKSAQGKVLPKDSVGKALVLIQNWAKVAPSAADYQSDILLQGSSIVTNLGYSSDLDPEKILEAQRTLYRHARELKARYPKEAMVLYALGRLTILNDEDRLPIIAAFKECLQADIAHPGCKAYYTGFVKEYEAPQCWSNKANPAFHLTVDQKTVVSANDISSVKMLYEATSALPFVTVKLSKDGVKKLAAAGEGKSTAMVEFRIGEEALLSSYLVDVVADEGVMFLPRGGSEEEKKAGVKDMYARLCEQLESRTLPDALRLK